MNHTSKSVKNLFVTLFSKKPLSILYIFRIAPRKMWRDMSKRCKSIIHEYF